MGVTDLVNWSDERMVEVELTSIGAGWLRAPEAAYDTRLVNMLYSGHPKSIWRQLKTEIILL